MSKDQQPSSATGDSHLPMKARPNSRVSGLSSARIALGYAVIAIVWIAFSDAVVTYFKLPPALMTIKGTLFVLVTATLLYFTIRRLVTVVNLASQQRLTERERAEEALQRLNRELRAISNCNQVLLRAADEQSLLKQVCRIVCEEAGYAAVWVGYAEQDAARSVRHVAVTGVPEESIAKLRITWADTERGRGIVGSAIRTAQTACIDDYATAPASLPWREAALQRGFRSGIALPLKDEHAKAFGSLNIYSTQPSAFTPEETRLLEELAGDLAFGIVTLRSRAARQQAEQEVALLSFALDKGRDAAFLIDDTAHFRYVNEEACRLLGYSRAELLGLRLADIDTEFPVEHWSDHWRDLKAQRSRSFESRHRTRDGRTFPVEISTNYFEYGGRAYHLALVRDITQRKRAEEALRESETRFRTFVDHAADALFIFDAEDGTIVDVNRQACESLGYTRQELIGTTGAAFHLEPEQGLWERAAAGETVIETHHHRRKNGTLFPVEVTTSQFSHGGRRLLLKVARDVTDRQRTQAALRAQANLLNLTHDAVFVMDMEGVIKYWNRGAEEQYGWTAEQTLGKVVHELLQTVFPKPRQEIIAEAVRAGRWEGELVHTKKNGAQLVVASRWSLQRGPQNAPAAILETNNDITERKRAEEEVRDTAAQWQATFDAVQDIVLLLDNDFRILRANRAAAQFLGVPLDKIVGQHCHDVVHGTSTPPADCPFARMRHSRRPEEVEVLARPGGPWLTISVAPLFDEKGELAQVVHVARDITQRKRAEEALRRNEAYLTEGQRLAHMGSWAWSPTTMQSLYWSEEMCRIYGFDPRDGVPSSEAFWQRIHPEDLESVRELLFKVAAGNQDYEHDHRILLPDGTVKHIHAIGHPVLNENGHVIEYVGTAIDVTERKLAEEELRKHRENLEEMVKHRTEQLAEAKARAEAANREKSRFLANMSHELRTPLNAVLGFSRLLKTDRDATPHQQETLDIIVRSGEHLLNLINNVLDMAKIESGRMVLEQSEVNLHQLLHEMQSLMGVIAGEKALRFALHLDPDLPQFIAVDAGKLRQVLLNLLGNAIKYTESGGVKLTASLACLQGSEKAEIRFEVEDSGPGITESDRKRIFLPFVQVGAQATAQAGTGLGLAICKQYVELMGGQIAVTSGPGKGSVFHFTIPVRILPSVAELEQPRRGRILGLAEGQPACRLLVVEDQPENRLLLQRLLQPLGFELREAANGKEAVALFNQWHPHLIWMDIRMPVMDGLEATRQIRAAKAGADTKIVALTAHALEEERGPIMAAGCDDLVRKPFREQELFDALARHLRLKFIYDKAPGQQAAEAAPGPALRPEQLDALPVELLRDLRQAVVELDTVRTQALIEQVTGRDAALGRALNTLARQLDYQRLLKLLERQPSQTGSTL